MPILPCFILAVVAGGSIGFGALYYSIVASDGDVSFATIRVLGGVVFSLGLAIVLIDGAEPFTGNNLIVMAWASGKIFHNGNAAQLGDRLCWKLFWGRRSRHPSPTFTSSRHEWWTHRTDDIEHSGRKDLPRYGNAVRQGYPLRHVSLLGSLVCLCRPFGHRQNCRSNTADLCSRRGWLRALRRQYVFSTPSLAPDGSWPGPR